MGEGKSDGARVPHCSYCNMYGLAGWRIGAPKNVGKGTGVKNPGPPIEFRKGGDCAALDIAYVSLAGAGSTLLCEERKTFTTNRTIEKP